MADINKKKKKIVDLFKNDSKPKEPTERTVIYVNGSGNVVAGRDVIQNINKKEIIRKTVKLGPEHITPAQALKLQQLVYDTAAIEATAGNDEGKARAKWFSILRQQYGVTTYREIPAHLGDKAIKWMQQRSAMLRPKLRRTDNKAWRNQHYRAIYARSKEFEISTGELYALVDDRLGVKVTSLKQLGERNLKKLYNIMMAMK